MPIPASVNIVEVGPRDGLQNEPTPVAISTKVELIHRLTEAGLRYIEAGSFVNPRWVPQMQGSADVFQQLVRHPETRYAALTPNLMGFEHALAAGATEVAVFAAASESFSKKNINCTIAESIDRFLPLMEAAKSAGIAVRGYVSCVVGCPYEGAVDAGKVREVATQLIDIGCYEISLGDTIGVGTPEAFNALLDVLTETIAVERLAVHCHDTYGMAIANIYAALQKGVAVIDSSVAGLGGCPYAAGASGNVATEDVVYLLNGLGVEHGVNLEKLIQAGDFISAELGRSRGSKVATALSTPRAEQ